MPLVPSAALLKLCAASAPALPLSEEPPEPPVAFTVAAAEPAAERLIVAAADREGVPTDVVRPRFTLHPTGLEILDKGSCHRNDRLPRVPTAPLLRGDPNRRVV